MTQENRTARFNTTMYEGQIAVGIRGVVGGDIVAWANIGQFSEERCREVCREGNEEFIKLGRGWTHEHQERTGP